MTGDFAAGRKTAQVEAQVRRSGMGILAVQRDAQRPTLAEEWLTTVAGFAVEEREVGLTDQIALVFKPGDVEES